jgi:hypothetical protein
MGVIIAIQLIFGLICGGVSAAIASSKGRSVIGWFFGGLFLGWVGIVVVCVLPNLKEQRFKEEAMERENRRLREQLMQEQIKTETFRQHAAARLDAHDGHLGIDTRSVITALPAPDNPAALTNPELVALPNRMSPNLTSDDWPNQAQSSSPFESQLIPAAAHEATSMAPNHSAHPELSAVVGHRQWYYEVQGKAQGPISDNELVVLAQQGIIVDSTLVWTQQLSNWKSAGAIKSLKQYLKS